MTATTLPASFQRNNINPATSTIANYDEFGAYSIPASPPTVASWDDQVVPALRRRLEEESRRLDQRIKHSDSQPTHGQQQYNQSTQHLRPVRRPDRGHQVLQDGLGSDDLIPSGWATGSSAQFAAIAPKAKVQTEDRLRSISAQQPYISQEFFSKEGGDYYPRHAGSPPSPLIRDSPSPSSSGNSAQNILQAREKARKLAKEREMLAYGHNVSPGAQSGEDDHYHQSEWLEGADSAEAKQSGRERTLSSPALQVLDGNSLALLPQSSDKTIMRQDSASKLPFTSSTSMPRSLNQDIAPQDLRQTKSAARLNTKQASSLQRYESQYRPEKGEPRTKHHNILPDQLVLDEFGPLGYTPPKGKRRPEGTNIEEAGMSAGTSAINAWDEEMIPTVKKRLEQQKMLEDLSRDEDLVDIWDRHGLPLSKRQVSLSQRASEGRRRASEGGNSSPVKKEAKQEANISVDEGSERIRRLHEQLDLGIFSSTDQQKNDDNTHQASKQEEVRESRQRENLEMQEIQKQAQRHKKTSRQHQLQQPQQVQESRLLASNYISDRDLQKESASPVTMPVHQNNSSKEQRPPISADVDASGCCKCIVM